MRRFRRSVSSGGKMLIVAVCAFVLLGTSGTGWAAAPKHLTMIGFLTGTSMQVRAQALGEVIRRWAGYNITVEQGRGGLGKPIDFIQGKSQLDISLTVLPLIREGLEAAEPKYIGKLKPDVIIPTEQKVLTFITVKNAPFDSLAEALRKKYPMKIGVGTGQTALAARKIFHYYGVSFKDVRSWGGSVSEIPPTQTTEMIKNGFENAYFSWGGYPSPHLDELNAARPVKFLPITRNPKELKALEKVLPGFYQSTMPAGGYSFVKEPVVTLGFTESLWVRPDLPDDMVYKITKAIWEHRDYLDSMYARFKVILNPPYAMNLLKMLREREGIPTHPGAMRYYRERGWMK